MFDIDPTQIQQLAMVADPQLILASTNTGGVTTPGAYGDPSMMPQAAPVGGGYAGVINPGFATEAGTGWDAPGTYVAPKAKTGMMDPKLMQQFGAMLQQPQQAPAFIGGAAPRAPGQVQMQPVTTPGAATSRLPGLAAILAGRG